MSEDLDPVLAAKQTILKEKKAREDLCAAEMMKLFEQHKCSLEVSMVLRPGKNPEIITAIQAK